MTGRRFRQVIETMFCDGDATRRDARSRRPDIYRRPGPALGRDGSPFHSAEAPPPGSRSRPAGDDRQVAGRQTVVIELVTAASASR